jgi:hypothetical protein
MTLLYLDTMNPKMVFENPMNALLGFILIPNSLHLRKHFFSFSKWIEKSLKIVKSSRKIFMNTSMYSWKAFFYYPLTSGQSIFDTKRHHNPHKSPLVCHKGNFVLVFWCDWYLMISWKLVQKGINFVPNNCVDDLICEKQWVKVIFCYCIEFPKINIDLQLSILLRTTTIGDSQVASSTNFIILKTNILFIFCLIIIT